MIVSFHVLDGKIKKNPLKAKMKAKLLLWLFS